MTTHQLKNDVEEKIAELLPVLISSDTDMDRLIDDFTNRNLDADLSELASPTIFENARVELLKAVRGIMSPEAVQVGLAEVSVDAALNRHMATLLLAHLSRLQARGN